MAEHTVHIPWYATVLRGDKFADALLELSQVAMQHGATRYELTRSHDDTYKFLQAISWSDKLDFDRFWYGEEASTWRARYQGWYQIPVLYGWQQVLGAASLEPAANGADAA